MVGSFLTFPMKIKLRTAAIISIEPSPRYVLCVPEDLFRCPISTMAHPVFSAIIPSFRNTGRTSFARFISTSAPINACTGSMITSRTRFCLTAFSIRSSDRVNASSVSSITITRLRSAPASISLGLIVSPIPSSAV